MPEWKSEIKGWGSIIESDDEFPVQRDKLVALLRDSDWFKSQDEDSDLAWAVDDLEYSQSAQEADEDALYRIYKLADDDRVWLSPFEN